MVIIPPVHVIAERRVTEHLRRYGAISAAKAMGYAPARRSHARALARLRAADVIKGPTSALWLDQEEWDQRRGKRRKRALALIAVTAVSAGIAAMATLRG